VGVVEGGEGELGREGERVSWWRGYIGSCGGVPLFGGRFCGWLGVCGHFTVLPFLISLSSVVFYQILVPFSLSYSLAWLREREMRL